MNLPEGIIRTYIMVMSFGTSAINSLECMHGTTSPLLNDDIFEGFLGGFGGGFFPAGFVQNVFRLRSARCFNPDDVCFRCEASLGPISRKNRVIMFLREEGGGVSLICEHELKTMLHINKS